MHLLLPLGLLALASILVLILIYIIKPKYHEKNVSSTFIWKLSLKYQKRRVPLQWLRRSLLFVLQLLILSTLAILIARPYIIRERAGGEKILILDASAGMLAEWEGTTRFERAINEIEKLIDEKSMEDKVTLILADGDAAYVLRRVNDREVILHALDRLECTFGAADIDGALTLASSVLDENRLSEVILYTDRDYVEPGYVTVKNLARAEWNAAVLEFDATLRDGYVAFTADIASYGRDADVSVSLYVDDALRSRQTLSLKDGEVTPLAWWNEAELRVIEYSTAHVTVEVEDSFPYDDTLHIYGNARRRHIELVSRAPNMLSMALYAAPENHVFQATLGSSTAPAIIHYEGYDLYVFEGELPARLPEDGGVLLIAPTGDTQGLHLGEEITGSFTTAGTDGISVAYTQLMKGLKPESIHISRYTKALSYEGYEVLMTVGDDPILLAGRIGTIPIVVLLFDIHYSDLPMLIEFPMLMGNICAHAAPQTLERYLLEVGSQVRINAKPNAGSVRLDYAGIHEREPSSAVYEAFPIDLDVALPGTYTVTQALSNGKVRTDRFFVRVPAAESDFNARGEVLSGDEYQNPTLSDTGSLSNTRYNRFEFFKYIMIFLLLLLVIEWGVQYREQF